MFDIKAEIDRVNAALYGIRPVKPAKPAQTTCWCGAYAFPHRYLGGQCEGGEEGQAVHPHFAGELPPAFEDYEPRDDIDHRLDDPRRGEAAFINRDNARARGEF